MLLPRLSKRLPVLLIISCTGVTLASWGKLCISNFQGLAVLSLRDSLWSSTHKGSIVSGWYMRLGENLLPWKSKDKKCSLYKTPYVAARIWVLGEVIMIFSALRATSYRCTSKSQIFFGSRVTSFWRDPSRHIKTPTWNSYKGVDKQKWYQKGLLIALLEESREEYLQVFLQADSALMRCHEKTPQEPWRSRWPQERNIEQSAPTHVHHTHCTSRQFGTTANQRYDVPWDWLWDACKMARVRWGTRCEGFCSKEGLH